MKILVTGSIATGKTTLCKSLFKKLKDYTFVNMSDLIINERLFSELDTKYNSFVVDE